METIEIYAHPYTYLKSKIPNYFTHWLILHFILMISFFLLAFFYPVEERLEYIGYYENYTVFTIVDSKYFSIQTKIVKIKEKNYSYSESSITPIAYENGNPSLWRVELKLLFPKEWKIENNRFELSFLKEKKTLFQKLIYKIKKGMIL